MRTPQEHQDQTRVSNGDGQAHGLRNREIKGVVCTVAADGLLQDVSPHGASGFM